MIPVSMAPAGEGYSWELIVLGCLAVLSHGIGV